MLPDNRHFNIVLLGQLISGLRRHIAFHHHADLSQRLLDRKPLPISMPAPRLRLCILVHVTIQITDTGKVRRKFRSELP